MGIIERSLKVSANKSKRVIAFFDTGSSFSLIDRSVVQQIGYLKKWKKPITVQLGDGREVKYEYMVLIGVMMNKNEYFHKFYVSDIPEQVVIGVDFLQEYGHTLEFVNDSIISKNMNLKNSRGKFVR